MIGILVSVLCLVSSRAVHFASYFTLWVLYLSIVTVGTSFFAFQWDYLLLEVGFIGMFFTPSKDGYNRLVIDEISTVSKDLLTYLAFRLHYSSAVSKLAT